MCPKVSSAREISHLLLTHQISVQFVPPFNKEGVLLVSYAPAHPSILPPLPRFDSGAVHQFALLDRVLVIAKVTPSVTFAVC